MSRALRLKQILRVCVFILIPISCFSSCGALQRARYHRPETTDTSIFSDRYGDGLIFKTGGLCVAIYEEIRSAYYVPLAAGPIGMPFFPLGVIDLPDYRPLTVDLGVWLTPDGDGFRFDPREVVVTYADGSHANPENRLESTPLAAVNWTSFHFFLSFKRPNFDVPAISVSLNGISRNSVPYSVPEIVLKEVVETRYLLSTTMPNRVPLGPPTNYCPLPGTSER